MPNVSIRLSDIQYQQMMSEALESGCSLSDHLKRKLFPAEFQTNTDNELTLESVMQEVSKLKSGQTFEIPSLFPKEIWRNFTNTVTIGRKFRIETKNEASFISQKVEFIEKKSGHSAIYRVK